MLEGFCKDFQKSLHQLSTCREQSSPDKAVCLRGVETWDTFMTLAESAKKLGVSFYQHV